MTVSANSRSEICISLPVFKLTWLIDIIGTWICAVFPDIITSLPTGYCLIAALICPLFVSFKAKGK